MLLAAGLPTVAPAGVTPEQYLEVMSRDKKNTGGDTRLVLLKSLGNAFVTSDYDASLLHDTLVESG
jgi:3-dehydroquinate synthase